MGAIMNSWIVTLYPSTPWKPICSAFLNFPSLFHLTRTRLFMSSSVDVSRKAELGRLLYWCTRSMLPVWFSFTFVALNVLFCLFYVLCCDCLLSMSGFCPWITFFWFLLESWYPWLLFLTLLSNTLSKIYTRKSVTKSSFFLLHL